MSAPSELPAQETPADAFAALWGTWSESAAPPDVFSFLESHRDLSPRERADVLLTDQFHRWRAGRAVPVEEYFARCPDVAADDDLRLEFILEEYGYRQEHGQSPQLEEFAGRFPELKEKLAENLSRAGSDHGDQSRRRDRAARAGGQAAHAVADRNLLFGILALQMDFVSRDALIAAMNAWVLEKARPLGELLAEQDQISRERLTLLDALVEEHLRLHGNDPERSLAAVSSIRSVRDHLEQIADPDVQASLARVASLPRADDPLATVIGSVGQSSSAGTRFRILRPHAKGGLGQVSVALDEELHREVALKEIQGQHADQPESRARFLLEAEITGGLEHPGIVPVYGLGTYAGGRPFYAMRFVRGDSLKAAIERFHSQGAGGRGLESTFSREPKASAPVDYSGLEFRQLLGRFVDVCNAIAYAHSRGVLHRDLKPGNVMLGPYGETLVVDWGLAKPLGRRGEESEEPTLIPSSSGSGETLPGSAIGTPAYMSPEQASGRLDELGPATDIYSLGATLYHLLTGKPPFESREIGEVLQRVQRGEFPRPRQVASNVPAALEAICLKSMTLRPQDRYGSVKDLAEDVEHWLADEPVRAFGEPVTARCMRWIRKHRMLATNSAAVVLVSSVGLAFGLVVVAGLNQRLGYANHELTRANKREHKARRQAELAKSEAEHLAGSEQVARLKLERTLVDMHTAQGLIADKHHDPAQAALWFAHAAQLASNDENRRLSNRSRAQIWTDGLPIPVRAVLHRGQEIRDIQFQPGGGRLMVLTGESRCIIWDIDHEDPLPLPGGERPVAFARWSPDGRWLALLPKDGPVEIRTADKGTLVRRIELDGPVPTACFSSDSRYLAFGGTRVRIWDCREQRLLSVELAHPHHIISLRFNSRGDRLVTVCSDATARVFRVADSSVNATPLFPPVRHFPLRRDRWTAPIFTNQDRSLVVTSGPTQCRVLDSESGKPGSVIPVKGSGGSIVASPRGDAYVICEFMGAQLWRQGPVSRSDFKQLDRSPRSSRAFPLRRVRIPHRNTVTHAAFSPDGRRMLTVSIDRSARLWSALDGRPLTPPLDHTGELSHAAFSADGRFFATAQVDGLVRVWTFANRASKVRSIPFECDHTFAALSPDGRYLAAKGSNRASSLPTTRVFDLARREPVGPPLPIDGLLTSSQFSPSGNELLTLNAAQNAKRNSQGHFISSQVEPGSVRIWDWRTGKALVGPLDTPSLPLEAAYAPSGKLAAVLCAGGEILLIDPSTGRIRQTMTSTFSSPDSRLRVPFMLYMLVPCRWLEFTPDGRSLVTIGLGNGAEVWDVDTGALRYAPLPHVGPCFDLAISADGALLATASQDQFVRIWSLATGKPVAEALKHPDWVFTVQFSRDGQYLLTACRDHMARVWDWRTGSSPCPPLAEEDEVFCSRFLPDERRIATVSRLGTLRIWERTTGRPMTSSIELQIQPYQLLVSPNGRHLVIAGGAPWVRTLDLDFLNVQNGQKLPDAQLALGNEVLSARTIHSGGGISNLTTAEWIARWQKVREHGSRDDLYDDSPEALHAWYRQQLEEAEATRDWSRVLWALDGLIGALPEDAALYAKRGTAHRHLGRHTDAESDYSRAIELGRSDYSVRNGRAESRMAVRKWGPAADDLSKAIEFQPDDWRLRHFRAQCYINQEKWEPARADLQKALELGGNTADLWTWSVLLPLITGDQQGYSKACRFLLDRSKASELANTWNKVAWMCAIGPQALDDYSEPLARIQRALETNRQSHIFLNTYGTLLYRAARYKEAIQQIQRGMRASLRPGQGSTSPAGEAKGTDDLIPGGVAHDWYVLAMSHHRLGNRDLARRWFEKASAWRDLAEQNSPEARIGSSPLTLSQRWELRLFHREAKALLGGKLERERLGPVVAPRPTQANSR